MLRYAWRDLVRNPRRTIAALVSLLLGVGLFASVLFFIDGSSATMTERALRPLALDMQLVRSSSADRPLQLTERLATSGPLSSGGLSSIVLVIRNAGLSQANDVVVSDQPPEPLSYVPSTTVAQGRHIPDVGGDSPLSQGPAGIGYNLGTVAPGTAVTLSYDVRATAAVDDSSLLPFRGLLSSREQELPVHANATSLSLDRLRKAMADIPGVAAARELAFVDLPPRSLRVGSAVNDSPVRLFAFDDQYARHYPSIRLVTGAFDAGGAVLSVEASRSVLAAIGSTLSLELPGRTEPVSLPVSGVADLSQARPLFSSRRTTTFEQFLYVPHAVVVSPATFENVVLPAFARAEAARGSRLRSSPLQEVDVLLDRGRLHAEPASALVQSQAVARAIQSIAPGPDYLIDNASNTLQVAKEDARVGRRLFLFLGVPGVVLAACQAAYAGGILASTERREQAGLRIRGASRRQLARLLVGKTAMLAGAGSLCGVALGFVTVLVVLGRDLLFSAGAGRLALSAAITAGVSFVVTAVSMYLPARGWLRREIAQQHAELTVGVLPTWRRWHLDLVLLGGALAAELVAYFTGAFIVHSGSVRLGQATALPLRLLVGPLVAWVGGVLLAARLVQTIALRIRVPERPRFGRPVRGILLRSLKRRPAPFVAGVLGVALPLAAGTGLVTFLASYDLAKANDARFVLGSDLRITPLVSAGRKLSADLAPRLRVVGVAEMTSISYQTGNALLVGPDRQDVESLAAVDPTSFRQVVPLTDALFGEDTADQAMAALQSPAGGLLVREAVAEELSIAPGFHVQVLLARGTKQQRLRTFRVVGVFRGMPGFPDGVDIVVNKRDVAAATGVAAADFYLARTTSRDRGTVDGAVRSLTDIGLSEGVNVETTAGALERDRSSLTALSLHGLIDIDAFYTVLLSAAASGIFVFGLLLHRRREYVGWLAQGLRRRDLDALLAGDALLSSLWGTAVGLLVGWGMGATLIRILRPLFVTEPTFTLALHTVALLSGLALASAGISALAASAFLRRLRPTELLRER